LTPLVSINSELDKLRGDVKQTFSNNVLKRLINTSPASGSSAISYSAANLH
jgi:hypothetical protein